MNNATADDVRFASDIFNKIANFTDANPEQRKNAIKLLDDILSIKEETFKESGRQTSDK